MLYSSITISFTRQLAYRLPQYTMQAAQAGRKRRPQSSTKSEGVTLGHEYLGNLRDFARSSAVQFEDLRSRSV